MVRKRADDGSYYHEPPYTPMCEHSGGCEGSLHRPQAANTAARLAGKLGSTARELRGGRSIPRRGTRVALGRSPLARVR